MTIFKKFARILIMGLATFALVLPAFALDVTVNLVAEQVNVTMADGQVVPMWGLRDAASPAGTATVPGPTISAVVGDRLILNLTNALPEPTSLVINGQQATEAGAMAPTWTDGTTGPRGGNLSKRVRSFTHEVAPPVVNPGNPTTFFTATYEWANLKAGTYLIASGSHPAVQLPMGLYAALTVQETPSPYANQVTLLFSEVDPELNAAVAAGQYGTLNYPTSISMGYQPKYFLINGQSYTPASTPIIAGNSNQITLLRFLNAGLRSRSPVLQNSHMMVIAEDGNPLPYQKLQYSLELTAGKTIDALMLPSDLGVYAVYDRALGLTNGGLQEGGMLANLIIGATAPFSLIYPNGGESLLSGSTAIVQWNSFPGAASYRLHYSTNNGAIWNFIATMGATTLYIWTVPTVQADSPASLVRVTALDGTGAVLGRDRSNSTFSIVAGVPSLPFQVISPNGGEIFSSGTVQATQWAPLAGTASYRLHYSVDNGATWNFIATVGGSATSYNWTIPTVAGVMPASLFRVTAFDSAGAVILRDMADASFTIQP